MKKYFLIFAVLLFSNFLTAQTSQKIGFVDSQVILTQLPEAIKAQGDLSALTNQWSAQLDSMTMSYQQGLADYQKQANTMPDAQKQAAQQNLIQLEQNILEFRREKFSQGGEIYRKEEEIFNPVKEKIYQAIEDVAKSEGIQFVFDKSGDIVLLYADSAFDVTYKVLDRLKRGN